MKRLIFVMVALVVSVMLGGCALLGSPILLPSTGLGELADCSPGRVPVVVDNPGTLTRVVYFFEGSVNVAFINTREGVRFNRPSIGGIMIRPATDASWHETGTVCLPAGSSVRFIDFPTRFGAFLVGSPQYGSYSVASTVLSGQCNLYTPSGGGRSYACGGQINLSWVDPSGPSTMRLNLELNPGQYLKWLILGY